MALRLQQWCAGPALHLEALQNITHHGDLLTENTHICIPLAERLRVRFHGMLAAFLPWCYQ